MTPGGKCAAVENGTVRPSIKALPWRSRASAPTNIVYVWSAASESWNTSVSLRPLQRRCLISTRGASSTASPAVRGSMPSLNSTEGWIPRRTPVAPESGTTSSTRGGVVSGGPPLGICLRAQLTAARTTSSTAAARARRASRTRVRLVIGLLEPRARDVRVDLRARETAVAQQLLYRTEIGAGVQQMARERVPERVGRDAEPARHRGQPPPHHALDGARRERAHRSAGASLAREQRFVARAGAAPLRREVTVERRECALAHRRHALLPPLAAHAQEPRAAVEVAAVEPDQLREPETRGVGHLEQRQVARGGGILRLCQPVQRLVQVDARQRARQALRQTWERQRARRIAREPSAADEEAAEAPPRGECARGGARRMAVPELLAQRALEQGLVPLPGSHRLPLARGEVQHVRDVAAVGGHRVRGRAPDRGQLLEEGLEGFTHRWARPPPWRGTWGTPAPGPTCSS